MDCFVLTTGEFAPRGKYRPGEQAPEPIVAFQPGRAWDFLPQADEFDPAALRIFAMIPPKAEDARLTDVDERELDAIFKVVAAM